MRHIYKKIVLALCTFLCALTANADGLYISNFNALPNNACTVSLKMKNSNVISGFQFDLVLPTGVSLSNVVMSSARTTYSYDITQRTVDGAIRIVCASKTAAGARFTGTDGEVMKLTLTSTGTGNKTITLKNQYLTESNLTEVTPANATVTMHVHALTATAAKAATCTAAGNSAYWKCSVCNKYYSNSSATTEVTQASTVIAALGHSYAYTSNGETTHHKKCSRCNIESDEDHTLVSGKCSLCGTTPVTGLTLNKTTATITKGSTLTLTGTITPSTATTKGITWSTSDANIATVSTSGVVTAKATGKVTITATSTANSSMTATCAVTVTNPVTSIALSKTTLSLTKGGNSTLTITYSPTDADNRTVTWKSSNTAVATVSTSGVVTAVATGSATITATSANGKTATCTVTVTNPVTSITLNKASLSLTKGGTSTLTVTYSPTDADNRTVTWKSSNTAVATVSTSGVVTAVATGSATITATSANGKTATCTVTVTNPVTSIALSKTTLSLTKGGTSTLTVTYSPTDADNRTVTWKSSNTAVATVSTSGVVTAVATGTATITATSANGKTATCAVTVTNPVTSITLDKTAVTITRGETSALAVTYAPADADSRTVTWKSNNTAVATVSSAGVITAIKVGTATITATSANGKTATCQVTVSSKDMTLIDGATSFVNDTEKEYDNLAYTRTISATQADKYQALYVPMKIDVASLDERITVYKIMAMFFFDLDGDGENDESYLRITPLSRGVLLPNHAYIFKASEAATYTIDSYDGILYPAEENDLTCSTTEIDFTFKGNYTKHTISTPFYGMSGGSIKKATGSVGAYRWYAIMSDKAGQLYDIANAKISIFENDMTDVDTPIATSQKEVEGVYSINGAKQSSLQKGLNIIKFTDGSTIKQYIK